MITLLCSNCGKKLAEIKIKEGKVEIKCPKCGITNTTETKKEKVENIQNISDRN